MSFKTIFAAIGLTVAALGASSAAQARDHWDDRRGGHERRWDHESRWDHDRRWDNDRRWDHDRRWKRDRNWGHHRVRCWAEWHHHRRVRVCR